MKRETLQGYFKKDVATLCILSLLDECEELYGYDIMQKMAQYSGDRFTLPEGTLYPILYRLEEQGYVIGEKRLVGKRMQRIYYRLSPQGRLFYRQMLEAYQAIHSGAAGILNRSERGENANA